MKNMETKLISSISIEEFIEKNNIYQVDKKISKKFTNHFNINRRQFLKYIGIGAIGLNLPFVLSVNRAEGFSAAGLIVSAFRTLEIAKMLWDVWEEMHGTLTLINESKERQRGAVNFELDDKYRKVFSGNLDYAVPPRSINKYEYRGPYSNRDGLFGLTAQTKIDRNRIENISVRVG